MFILAETYSTYSQFNILAFRKVQQVGESTKMAECMQSFLMVGVKTNI